MAWNSSVSAPARSTARMNSMWRSLHTTGSSPVPLLSAAAAEAVAMDPVLARSFSSPARTREMAAAEVPAGDEWPHSSDGYKLGGVVGEVSRLR